MKAHLRKIRTSPKKMQIMAAVVRNMDAEKSLDLLGKLPQKTAGYLKKVLTSALANAKVIEGIDPKDLRIARIDVQDGPRYKRFKAGSRGMAIKLVKRSIHLSLYLTKK